MEQGQRQGGYIIPKREYVLGPEMNTEQQALYNYRSFQFERAISAWERQRNDVNAAVVLAFVFIEYSKISHLRRACDPNPSFPTEFYNELLHMHGNVYRAIPSAVTAAAVAWNPSVGKQYGTKRPFPVVLFEERVLPAGTRTVVYAGDNW